MTISQESDSLDDILGGYLDRLDNGEPVDREALLAKHPTLAKELACFFDDCDAVSQVVHGFNDDELLCDKQGRNASRLKQSESNARRGAGASLSSKAINDASLNEILSCLQHLDELCPEDGDHEGGQNSDPPPQLRRLLSRENSSESTLGRFNLRRLLGRGGFGIVFLADDPSLCRSVALKIPRPQIMFSRQAKQRFVREAQLAALLDHPAIVPVYETGEIGPLWYIAGAYCSGPTLAAWFAQSQQSVCSRLAAHIVRCLSDAVQHAHSRGVLHRDLKPSNILLEPIEKPPLSGFAYAPKVTDFGLGTRLEEPHDLTRTGMLMGTSRYMAPEQTAGDAKSIGIGTDIYTLGVILYELLTGSTPFVGKTDSETLRSIQHDLPSEAPLRARKVPRDLQAICLKCLAKQPQHRYSSAAELTADLERHLSGHPVTARSVGPVSRGVRWCGRHPTVTALLAGLLVVTLTGALGVLWQWRRAERNYADTRSLLYAANMKLAEAAWEEGNLRAVHQLLEPFGDSKGETDLRGWEWYFFRRLCNQDLLTIEGSGRVHFLSARRDDASVLVGTSENNVWSFDKNSGAKQQGLMLEDQAVTAAKSDDGVRVAALDRQGIIKFWTVSPSQQLIAQIELGGTVRAGAFTSDLTRLAAAGDDLTLRIWDLPARSEFCVLDGHTAPVTSVSFSADEKQLISGGEDGTIRIWDLQQGKQISLFEHPERSWVLTAVLSNNGKLLGAGCKDGSIVIWDITSGRQVLHLFGHTGTVDCLAFSANDERLVSCGVDRTIRVWEMPHGVLMRTIRGHLESVKQIAFLDDYDMIVSGSRDETVKLWDLSSVDFAFPRPQQINVVCMLFSSDGRSIACQYKDGTVIVFALPSWRELNRFSGPPDETEMAYDATRDRIAVSHPDATIELWQGKKRFREFRGHTAEIRCLALSEDGRWLASGGIDRTLKIWDIESGRLRHEFRRQSDDILCAAFSPDSKLLVSSSGGVISFWNPLSGTLERRIEGHNERTYGVSFNETGELLATGDRFGTIHVWDAVTGARRATLTGHTDRVYACLFSNDPRRLVSCSRDGTVRWWDLTTSRELCVVQGEWGPIEHIALSPDGWTLAAKNKAGS